MPLGTSSAFAICNIPNLYTNFRCNFFDKNEIEPPYMVALLLCDRVSLFSEIQELLQYSNLFADEYYTFLKRENCKLNLQIF